MANTCFCILFCGFLLACSEHVEKRANLQSSQRDVANERASASVPPLAADTVGSHCFQEPGTLRVSEDSVGPLDLRMSLKRLRAVCPSARDTVDSEGNTTSPSLAFHFKGLTAVATQLELEDSLLPGQPADVWLVHGENGLLYGRIPLTATWAAFRDALGTGISGGVSRDGKNVTVMFCAHPRAFLDFEFSDSVEDQSSDLSHIPNDARLKDVAVFLRAKPTWNC